MGFLAPFANDPMSARLADTSTSCPTSSTLASPRRLLIATHSRGGGGSNSKPACQRRRGVSTGTRTRVLLPLEKESGLVEPTAVPVTRCHVRVQRKHWISQGQSGTAQRLRLRRPSPASLLAPVGDRRHAPCGSLAGAAPRARAGLGQAVIKPPRSEADYNGTIWGVHPIWLAFDDTDVGNAARWLLRLELQLPLLHSTVDCDLEHLLRATNVPEARVSA